MYDCKLPNDSVVCRHKHRRREGLGLGERSTEEPGLGAILVWKPPGTQVVHYPFFAIALRILFLPRCLLAGYKCADVETLYRITTVQGVHLSFQSTTMRICFVHPSPTSSSPVIQFCGFEGRPVCRQRILTPRATTHLAGEEKRVGHSVEFGALDIHLPCWSRFLIFSLFLFLIPSRLPESGLKRALRSPRKNGKP